MEQTKRIPKIALVGLALSMLTIWSTADSPTAHAAPTMLTLTGFILPVEYADAPRAYTLRFNDQSWIFKLTNVQVLSGYPVSTQRSRLLNALGLRTIRLIGDEEIAAFLRTEDFNCKAVKIRGNFYESEGTLFLASIEDAPKEGRYQKCY